MDEKFCLRWNDFQTTVSNSFGILRQEKDLFDVTLVSDDEVQVSAHKVVLSACSSFFKSILKAHLHSHPLIYLSGINSRNLGFILDYIYQGEVKIYQGHLDSFLGSAQKLKIGGLLQQEDGGAVSNEKEQSHVNEVNFTKNEYFKEEESLHSKSIVMDTAKSIVVDNASDENLRFQCDQCDRRFSSKHLLNRHIDCIHLNARRYPCRYGCDFRFNDQSNRKVHERKKHGAHLFKGDPGFVNPLDVAC